MNETGIPIVARPSLGGSWYAVYTKFQHEKSAACLLERKQLNVFLPVYHTVHRWKDRNKTVILPLFPCYLFVHINLGQKLDVLRTAGVRWIVENGGHACEVADSEIAAVRRICSIPTRVQPHPYLRHGDMVRVRTGPLAGIQGCFARMKNQYRVVISIELLLRSVAVEVDLADVESLTATRRSVPGSDGNFKAHCMTLSNPHSVGADALQIGRQNGTQ